jgi:protoporphyrin/coproporphyrin ferrochelatase
MATNGSTICCAHLIMNVEFAETHTPSMEPSGRKHALLLLAHGSPESVDDVPEFLQHVTGGRPLPPSIVDEVKHRYGLIGQSPLTRIAFKQAEFVAKKLGIPVYVGMRNWKPFIAETVQQMSSDGTRHALAICLSPQNSRTSVGLYRSALNGAFPFTLDFVDSWHNHPLLIQAFTQKLRDGWEPACRTMGAEIPIVFTAHSVPQRTITDGDPYETQVRETACLVAQETGLQPGQWHFAFQSQGMTGGPWLGPSLEQSLLLLKAEGHRAVFVQPVGFLSDHVEVLYDIDIAFKQHAEKEGMRLWRAESLNDSPLLIEALVDLSMTRLMQAR